MLSLGSTTRGKLGSGTGAIGILQSLPTVHMCMYTDRFSNQEEERSYVCVGKSSRATEFTAAGRNNGCISRRASASHE